MKNKPHRSLIVLALLAVSTLHLELATANAQGTAFTYQGSLNDGANPANGNYDLQFILFNTNQFGFPAAPILTNAAVPVNNGLFTTTLDFGSGIFTGTSFWLEIAARTNGNGAFTTLAPRQEITPVPYAITATSLSGVLENNMIQSNISFATIAGGAGNAIQSGANNSTIGGGGYNTIQTGADHSTIGGGYNNGIEPGAWESFIGGGQGNFIETNAVWSAIGGGLDDIVDAQYSFIGGGFYNRILTNAYYSAIAGGYVNTIQSNAYESVIGGGSYNTIQSSAFSSTVSGGLQNTIQSNAWYSTIGGGYGNTVQAGADDATVGGGYGNTIEAFESVVGGGQGNVILSNSVWSTIAGGLNNRVPTNASFSSIGGGDQNTASNQYATVSGGYNNIASGIGAFVGGGGYDGFDFGAFNVASGPASVIVGGVGNNSSGYDSFVGAGVFNNASGQDAVVGGGSGNIAEGVYSTLGGGLENTNSGFSSTIGGGFNNTASGADATVPGGYGNVAGGDLSFAAGNQAQSTNQGAFVWADSQNATYSSTADNQFLIRAAGGVGINTNNPNGASLFVSGNRTGSGGNAFKQSVGWFENTSAATGSSPALRVIVDGGDSPNGALNVSANGTGRIAQFGNGLAFVASVENDGTIYSKGVALTSDRNAKENFSSLSQQSILAKIAAMPVTEWNYKGDAADKRHIGPVAQDFHAAFGLDGSDDKHISVVDESGVALAAIQALNLKLNDKEAEIQSLKSQNDSLAKRLNELESAVKNLSMHN